MTIINTHILVKDFVAHGFTKDQAEFMTDIFNQYITKDHFIEMQQNLVTKDDLRVATTELKIDIAVIKQTMATKADIAEIKSDILKWIIPFFATTTLAIIGLIASLIIKVI